MDLKLICPKHGEQLTTHVALEVVRRIGMPARIQLVCGCVFCWDTVSLTWNLEPESNGLSSNPKYDTVGPQSRTPIMDKYNLHGVGGYANDPNTDKAIKAQLARWAALTPEERVLAKQEAASLRTPDGPGR